MVLRSSTYFTVYSTIKNRKQTFTNVWKLDVHSVWYRLLYKLSTEAENKKDNLLCIPFDSGKNIFTCQETLKSHLRVIFLFIFTDVSPHYYDIWKISVFLYLFIKGMGTFATILSIYILHQSQWATLTSSQLDLPIYCYIWSQLAELVLSGWMVLHKWRWWATFTKCTELLYTYHAWSAQFLSCLL